MEKKNEQYSMITEQGDLGLGAELLSEAENEQVKEAEKKK